MPKTKWRESKELHPTPIQSIDTKAQFVREYQAGRLGNRAPTWQTLEEYLTSSYKGLVHIRNRVAGGPTWYDVPAENVAAGYVRIIAEGLVGPGDVYFSGMAPTDKTIFQGEVRQSERHLDLYYSTITKPMRASLLEGGRQVHGLEALGILKALMDPSSLDWVQTLLDRYPWHVIEFSTYSVNWGTLNLPTVIWEVRGGY